MAGDVSGIEQEVIGADEQEAIAAIVRDNIDTLDMTASPVKRGQHPKHHGCVTAKFIVERDLRNLEAGLFKPGATYDALIRFSNGRQTDDREPDIHGMAIKLFNVPGQKLLKEHESDTTHDFVLIDNEVFFSVDLKDYVPFNRDVARLKKLHPPEKLGEILLAVTHPVTAIRVKHATSHTPTSPLNTNYWSTTPYKLGSQKVKYMAKAELWAEPPVESVDGLSEALVRYLSASEARFVFGVHVQNNPKAQPIEDPTVNWSENGAEFFKLATILIPPQAVDPQAPLAERLAFSPWQALEAHRPLGAINRARRDVYGKMAECRDPLKEGERV